MNVSKQNWEDAKPMALMILLLLLLMTVLHYAFAQANFVVNGGFESGLSGWQTSRTDFGLALVTNSTAHSGKNSLQLELWPTNMMTDTQIVAVSQTVQVTGPATLEAWYMSPSCQFPAGDIEGRLVILIGTATVQQILGATCGSWQHIQQNVTSNGSAVIELELVRSLTLTQFALTNYWPIYWDDISVQNTQTETTTTVQSAIIASTTQPSNTSQTPTTPSAPILSAQPTLDEGLAEATITIGTLTVIGVAMFLVLVSRKRGDSNMIRCRRCGIMNRKPITYCTACGARVG